MYICGIVINRIKMTANLYRIGVRRDRGMVVVERVMQLTEFFFSHATAVSNRTCIRTVPSNTVVFLRSL